MKVVKYVTLFFALIFMSGCGNPIYLKNVETAYSKLKVGMTKSEVGNLFVRSKFMKEQTVFAKDVFNEKQERLSLINNKEYDDIYPSDIFSKIRLDGKVKVLSYFIKKTLAWPNGWNIHYVSIFYNEKENKVIGWGRTYNNDNFVRTWTDKF